MNVNRQFKEVEDAFQEIRRQFRRKEISRREFIDGLKKLRLRDDQGRFWMIGAQSGKWYYFDGKDWIQSAVPAAGEGRILCPDCGHGNLAGAALCEGCGAALGRTKMVCPECGRPLEDPAAGCASCGRRSPAVPRIDQAQAEIIPPGRLVLKRVDPLSAFLFYGGFGVVFGIICGAFIGTSGYFSDFAKSLPSFFTDLHGTTTGGIVFGFTGGVAGFVLCGILGFLSALLFNIISSFVGGLKMTSELYEPEIREAEGEEKSDGKILF